MNNYNSRLIVIFAIVVVIVVGLSIVAINRTQCITKFDTVAEIEKCMRLVD